MPDQAPMYQGLRIYPRGFLGASLGEQVKPTERASASDLRSFNYHPDWFKAASGNKEINRNVEMIWRHLNTNTFQINDMAFRKEVLRVALHAFGTKDFMDWVLINRAGPSTGEMHMEFIADTLNFIQNGKRDLTLHNWIGMLSNSDITHNTTKDFNFTEFFVGPDKVARNINLVDVIQRWCAQEDGFLDMAVTLHVLFGEV